MNKQIRKYELELRKYVREYDATTVMSWRQEAMRLALQTSAEAETALALELMSLATDEQIRGELAVFDRDSAGWARMGTALRYVRHAFSLWPGVTGLPMASAWLLQALAFEDDECTDEFGTLLEKSLAHDPFAGAAEKLVGEWDVSPIPRFSLMLWCMARGRGLPDFERANIAALGDYELVFQMWEGEEFSTAFETACDLHYRHADDKRSYVAFARGHRIFAPELHALTAVRKQLGFVDVSVEHELMATPLAKLPNSRQNSARTRDDLLERMDARVCQ